LVRVIVTGVAPGAAFVSLELLLLHAAARPAIAAMPATPATPRDQRDRCMVFGSFDACQEKMPTGCAPHISAGPVARRGRFMSWSVRVEAGRRSGR
jgi:hypothetical protein